MDLFLFGSYRPFRDMAHALCRRCGGTDYRRRRFRGCESADGTTLFYTKAISSPLFARPLAGGAERQLLDWVSPRAFAPVDDGIYYIGRRTGNNGQYPLEFFQFSSQASRVLTNIDGAINLGLSVSPDRTTILFSQTEKLGADLMMIENFM
jgi:hypothetical protein